MKTALKLIVLLTAVFIIGIKGVKADTVTITKEYIDDVWSFHYRNGDIWTFGNLPYNYANGKLVYCIQPDARINIDTYYTYSDFSISGYSEEEKRQMELISYYGYGYPGHESVKYYMATQELLWLFSPDEYITWNTSKDEDGAEINISNEKNEIMRLVNNHNKKPSFYKEKIEVDSESITLTDTYGVLDNYDITGSNLNIIRNGNSLVVSASKLGDYEIKFTKRRTVSNQTLVYNNESLRTQKLAIFKEPNINEFSMKISFKNSKIVVLKKDSETKELIKDSGIKIKIKDTETNNYVTDELEFKDGKIDVYLPKGKYKIEEISASNNYYINKDGVYFEIGDNDLINKEVILENFKVKGKIIINKTNEENENLSNVKFEVYDMDGNVVDEILTTKEQTESNLLPLGNYKVKEVESLYGYEKDNNLYEVSLNYVDQNTSVVVNNLSIVNKKIKCDIVLITTSGEKKIDASFKIYDLDMNIVYEGKTKNGKASFYLNYGDYILKEMSVPDGYKLNDKEIKFSVNDRTCASNFSIDNEEVIMPITTSSSSFYYLLLFIVNSFGYVIYKKNN